MVLNVPCVNVPQQIHAATELGFTNRDQEGILQCMKTGWGTDALRPKVQVLFGVHSAWWDRTWSPATRLSKARKTWTLSTTLLPWI